VSASPGIAWIILSPTQIPTLALKNYRGMKGGAIGTHTLNDRNKFAIAVLYLRNGLLIAVNQDLYCIGFAELDALVLRVADQILSGNDNQKPPSRPYCKCFPVSRRNVR
jgi:hypothetical protein